MTIAQPMRFIESRNFSPRLQASYVVAGRAPGRVLRRAAHLPAMMMLFIFYDFLCFYITIVLIFGEGPERIFRLAR